MSRSENSRYSLYDMVGNVGEWRSDWLDDDYYYYSHFKNPQGPENAELRIIRGGSWIRDVSFIRLAGRYHGSPTHHNTNVGFRCARQNM